MYAHEFAQGTYQKSCLKEKLHEKCYKVHNSKIFWRLDFDELLMKDSFEKDKTNIKKNGNFYRFVFERERLKIVKTVSNFSFTCIEEIILCFLVNKIGEKYSKLCLYIYSSIYLYQMNHNKNCCGKGTSQRLSLLQL